MSEATGLQLEEVKSEALTFKFANGGVIPESCHASRRDRNGRLDQQ